MKYFRTSLLSMLSGIAAALLLGGVALAQTPVEVKNPLGIDSICDLLKLVLNAAMIIGVPIAVLLIIWAGFRFVAAQGSESKLEEAKRNMLYVVIGIAVFFGGGLIADVILGTLVHVGVSGIAQCSF